MGRPVWGGPQVQGIADIREQVQSRASELVNVLEGTSGTERCRLGKEERVTREVFPDWCVGKRRIIRSCPHQQAWDPWSRGQQAGSRGREMSLVGLLARGGAAWAHRLPEAGAVWTEASGQPGELWGRPGRVRPPGLPVLLVWLRESNLCPCSWCPLLVGNIIRGMFWPIEVAESFGDTVI